MSVKFWLGIIAIAIGGLFASGQDVPVNIVILGDSNIWLAGDSCDNHTGWAAWMKDSLNPSSCVSYARSGASWSNTSDTKYNPVENIAILGDDNVIYNQVIRLIEASVNGSQVRPDVILISAGGNDAWFHDRRPMEFTETVDEVMARSDDQYYRLLPAEVLSLPGAIRHNVVRMRSYFPDAQIIFCTPTQMVKAQPEVMERVSSIIESTGNSLGIPTLRLDRDGPINRDVELQQHVNTYDGTHTNETGARLVGNYVADRLRILLHSNLSPSL